MKTPTLQNNILTLRPLTLGDIDAIFALRSSEINAQYIDRPICQNREAAAAFVEKILGGLDSQFLYWVIDTPECPSIGTVGLWQFNLTKGTCDFGYEIHPDHHGRGIAQAAIGTVLAWALENLPYRTIEAEVDDQNLASVHLLKKFLFVPLHSEDGISIYHRHLD